MKKQAKLLLLVSLLAALTAVPLSPAFAAAIWERNTLTEVYNPTGNVYAYAPTVIREGDTEHIWTCHNAQDGVFKDHIFYTKVTGGAVAESRSVLQAGPSGAWDSFHVCDPAVVAGQFSYDGNEYGYAMFYLGNDVDGSHHNQIGVAFANSLSGDWVKYPSPIVSYPNDGYWGVGQPSATSIDGQGRLMLFFTKGDPQATGGYRIDMNLRDMSNPAIGPAVPLTTNGLAGTDGAPDWLNNFDIVYDPSRDRFYAVREMHPYPSTNPAYISTAQQIVSIAGGSVWGGGGQWRIEGTLNEALTGFPRNHNAALLRTAHGTLPAADRIEVYFTDSDADPNLNGRAEFTYDVWKIGATLNNEDPVVETEITGMRSKHLSVTAMVTNLVTGGIELYGSTDRRDRDVWVGYAIYDRKGYLIEAGTAYKNRVGEDGAFRIPIAKPQLTEGNSARLEVYLLSPKGKRIEAVDGNVDF